MVTSQRSDRLGSNLVWNILHERIHIIIIPRRHQMRSFDYPLGTNMYSSYLQRLMTTFDPGHVVLRMISPYNLGVFTCTRHVQFHQIRPLN